MPTRRGGPRPTRRIERPLAAAAPVSAAVESPVAPKDAAGSPRNPRFPLGVDIWPLDSDAAGPGGWYQHDLSDELRSMADSGISLVRVYASWRLMEPQVGQYDEASFDRLARIIAEAGSRAMRCIVVLFSSEPHSQPSAVPWAMKRDPRTDSYLLERAADFASHVASVFRHERALFGWQLGDEAFLGGFDDADSLDAWASRIAAAVREGDPDRPIALGSDPESLAGATRIDLRDMTAHVEFGTSHVTSSYLAHVAPGPIFTGPPTRLRGFLLQVSRRGLPTVADGLGVPSLDCSPAEEAAALRLDLATSLLHGAAGAMLGRWRDLVTEAREPYRIEPHEVLVGVTDSEGRQKASYAAFAEFARLIAAADLTGVEPLPERLAVLMGEERFEPLPSLGSVFAPRSTFTAWWAAREAQIPATVVFEDDDPSPYGALVVPSVCRLADETWDRLTTFVAEGGTLLYSFGGGDAHGAVRDLFGVDFLGDSGTRDTFDVRVAQPGLLGDLTSFDAPLRQHAYALLAPGDATVVATDARGNPLLTVATFGQGRAIFLASPLERAISAAEVRNLPDEVAKFLRTIIGAAARGAGCGAPVEADDPDVELGLLQGPEDDLLLAVNHAREARTPEISSARRVAAISDIRGGSPVAIGATTFGVPLAASGVAILRIVYG